MGSPDSHRAIQRHANPLTPRLEAEAWARDIETTLKCLLVSAKEAEQYTLSERLERYMEEYIPRLKHAKR